MDYIFRKVMVASRDKDLLSGDAIAAVVLRNGFCTHQSQIRAAVWFGQVHGAGPVTAYHFRQICGLLIIAAMGMNGRIGPMGQTLVHIESHIG